MILIYPFYPGDEELALKNAKWMNELGGCKGHQVVVCYDPRCTPGVVEEVGAEMLKAFDKVWRLPATAEVDGWPEGANYLFRISVTWLQNHPEWPHFMWFEPDAVPLVAGWMDALEAEYKRAGKRFMGDRVQVNDIPLHMSGVGIYPNPLHAYAGEAYRAHDTAWDMAGKDQIIPQAHFTDLIEHAWKHPQFHNLDELKTQIAPQTILFHSSKDGSLIDLLRQKAAPETDAHSVATEPTSGVHPSREEIGTRPAQPPPICDIFIRTYPGDYYWLDYCLQSIEKYVSGFRKIWIVSPSIAPPITFPANAEWKQMNDESPDGYLAQQITKLYADVTTNYQPDYILHVDSDVIFARPVTPKIFFNEPSAEDPWGALPLWYYTPFEAIETPWKPIVEKFMRQPVAYEFMRSMPFMIPRWLYAKLREYCHATHGQIISDYVRMQPQRAFSEFNIMGAYAYRNHTKAFKWVNTLDKMPQHVARQFRSWDGVTPENKAEIETILSGGAENVHTPLVAAVATSAPSIKKLPNDVWVLEGDQISQWVEQENRLDHDQNFLPKILPHINPGDTVIDIGAFIGDHTVAYSKAVGEKGHVYAFEPNPMAATCLRHNTAGMFNVATFERGLSDKDEDQSLSGNNGNWGGCYIGEHMKVANVWMNRLDDIAEKMKMQPSLIKIDTEGYELKVLRGGEQLINTHLPKMVIEVNYEALKRQGSRVGDIYKWLEEHQYDWTIMQENCTGTSPLYDILCFPQKQPSPASESEQDEVPLTTELSIQDHVKILREYSERGKEQRKYVMGFLKKHRLVPLRPPYQLKK